MGIVAGEATNSGRGRSLAPPEPIRRRRRARWESRAGDGIGERELEARKVVDTGVGELTACNAAVRASPCAIEVLCAECNVSGERRKSASGVN